MSTYYIAHHGIEGQKWGVRRWQNEDGSLTTEGRIHYGYGEETESAQLTKSDKKKQDLIKLRDNYKSHIEQQQSRKLSDVQEIYKNKIQNIVNKKEYKTKLEDIKNKKISDISESELYDLRKKFKKEVRNLVLLNVFTGNFALGIATSLNLVAGPDDKKLKKSKAREDIKKDIRVYRKEESNIKKDQKRLSKIENKLSKITGGD